MAHWLADIERLFTCDSSDLADLARAVGYDPERFYVGTLSAAEIEALILRPQPLPSGDRPFEIDGDLGPALAYLPLGPDRPRVFDCEVRLFRDQFALQEAFFRGDDWPDNLCAVLCISDNEPVLLPDLALITPVLEILAKRTPVLLLIDAVVFDLKAAVPAISNFARRAVDGRTVRNLAEKDTVQFHPSARKVLLGPAAPALTNKPRDVRASSFVNRSSDRDIPSQSLYSESLKKLEAWLLQINADFRKKNNRPKRDDPFLRLFHNTCVLLLRVCNELKILGSYSNEINSSLLEIADHLVACVRAARNSRAMQISETGYLTLIEILELCDRFIPRKRQLHEAFDALGQLYIQMADPARAINALTAARSFSTASETVPTDVQLAKTSQLLSRLASQYRMISEVREAERLLSEAEQIIASGWDKWRPSFDVLAAITHVSDERIALALSYDQLEEAVELSRSRIKTLGGIRYSAARTPNFRHAEFFSKIFRRHRDLLQLAEEWNEAFLAQVGSTLLHLDRHGPSLTNTDKLNEVERQLRQLLDAAENCMQKSEGPTAIPQSLKDIFREYGLEDQNSPPDAVWATLRAVRWRLGPLLPDIVNLFGEREMLFDEPIPNDYG